MMDGNSQRVKLIREISASAQEIGNVNLVAHIVTQQS